MDHEPGECDFAHYLRQISSERATGVEATVSDDRLPFVVFRRVGDVLWLFPGEEATIHSWRCMECWNGHANS